MHIPTEPEELRQLLWLHLQQRLSDRRDNGVDLGVRSPELWCCELKFLTGQSQGAASSPTDVHLGTGGKTLISHLTGIYADDQWHADKGPQGRILTEEVYELVRLGILRPDHESEREAHFFITPHGAKCLETDDRGLSPLSEKWVEKMKERFADDPNLNLLVVHYREALDAYRAGLDLSAMVMIGACYELGLHKVAREIAELALRDAGKLPAMSKRQQDALESLRSEDKYVSAARIEIILQRLLVNGLKASLAKDDAHWAELCLNPSLLFVRKLRNKAGHPTGDVVPRDIIHSHIFLFQEFYNRTTSIAATIKSL